MDRIGRDTVVEWWLAAQESPRTREEYERIARQWFAWCDRRGLDVWQVRRPDVDGWRNELGRAFAKGTVGKNLACLSSFYRYAAADVDPAPVEHNPVQSVRRPKLDKVSHADGLSDDEARQLLEAAGVDGPRTAALVHLLLGTAARISEIVNATTSDLRQEHDRLVLRVVRKGGVEGFVIVRPDVMNTVRSYLDGRGPVDAGWLIATTGGRRMTRQTAYDVVSGLAQKTLAREVTIGPHDLRHTSITMALEDMELHEAQQFAGHARAATTERYDRRAHTRGAAAAGAVEQRLRPRQGAA